MTGIAFNIIGTRDFLRDFFRKFPNHSGQTTDPKEFTRIIKEFHSDFINAVTTNRFGADLPLATGNLKVIAYKSKRPLASFFNRTHVGDYTNNHTNGLSCKILFTNRGPRYKLKDKIIWAFYPSVKFSKAVSKSFCKEYTKYIVSPNRGDINKRFDIFKHKKVSDEQIEEFLKTYNEFELD